MERCTTPTAETGGRCVFYNKDIFEELGLEVPKTFSEFEDVLAKIAESDYTPIAFSATDPWAILFQFEPVLNAMSVDWTKEYEENGTIKVNDERVVAAYDKMLEWAERAITEKATWALMRAEHFWHSPRARQQCAWKEPGISPRLMRTTRN